MKFQVKLALFQAFFLYYSLLSVAQVVKHSPANAGAIRDGDSILGLGRSAGGGHNNPLQYSCLRNSVDRRAWRATVHRVAKIQT